MSAKKVVVFLICLIIVLIVGLILGFFVYYWKSNEMTISGKVTDIIDNPLAGQEVELISGSSMKKTKTNGNGEFEFKNVSPKDYLLKSTFEDEYQAMEINLREDSSPFNLHIPVLASEFNFMPPVSQGDIVTRSDGNKAIGGEIVVRWQQNVTKTEKEQITTAAGATLSSDTPEIYLSLLEVEDKDVDATVEKLNDETRVVVATPSYILATNLVPEEDEYKEENKNWWLKKVNAEPAWDISTGSPYYLVGVIDSGFDLEHEDLNKAFVKAQANYSSEDLSDNASHGTHVTGIVGMRINNDTGLVGIAPNTRMAVAKTESLARAADAFRFFSRCPSVKVVSISMGKNWWSINDWRFDHGLPDLTEAQMRSQSDAMDLILEPALDLLVKADKLLVHSAGNDAGDASLNTLNFDTVMTVAASQPDDTLRASSNYGARVDIAAPGASIYSSIPGGYDFKSGTSMAAPLVAGTAAMIRAENPKLKYDKVKEVLTDTAVDVTGLSAHNFGRLDAWRALLKATKQMGVEGFVFEGESADFIEGAKITDYLKLSVLSNEKGYYRISALPWQNIDLSASKDQKRDKQTVIPPQDDLVADVDFSLNGEEETNVNINENANINNNANTNTSTASEVYIIWEGANASVGIHITTQEKYEAEELAKNYSGGGVSDTKILEKSKFVDQTFSSFDEANGYICSQLTEVRYYPFIGLGGKYNDETYIIGNFNCD